VAQASGAAAARRRRRTRSSMGRWRQVRRGSALQASPRFRRLREHAGRQRRGLIVGLRLGACSGPPPGTAAPQQCCSTASARNLLLLRRLSGWWRSRNSGTPLLHFFHGKLVWLFLSSPLGNLRGAVPGRGHRRNTLEIRELRAWNSGTARPHEVLFQSPALFHGAAFSPAAAPARRCGRLHQQREAPWARAPSHPARPLCH
jgi:hypothetical protein